MKKQILTLSLIAGMAFSSMAQTEKYVSAMTEITSGIQQVQGKGFLPFANKMERIAAAEANEWLPNYWAAYCYINESFTTEKTADKDLLLDKAEGFLVKAESLAKDNDELEVVKAQYAMARVSVDPMSRWQKYGADFQSALAKAEKLNPGNPRIFYTMGLNTFYTPEGFGGGKSKAKPLFEKASGLFEKQTPATAYSPAWGKGETQYFLQQCN